MREFLNKYRYIIAALALVPVIAILAARLIHSPAEQVAATIHEMVGFVEREDADGLAPFIADSYEGEIETSKRDLLLLAEEYFNEVRNTNIKIYDVYVKIEGETAAVLVVYDFSTTVPKTELYNNVPVRGIYQEDPNMPEFSYVRMVEQGDDWRLEYIVVDGIEYLEQFSAAREKNNTN